MKALAEAIYTILSADSTLMGYATGGIYHAPLPQNTSVPCIVIQKVTGDRDWAFRDTVVSRNYDYDVKGISNDGDASSGTFGDRLATGDLIAERVETLLNGAALSVTGYTLLVCEHEAEIDYFEPQVGRTLHHRGGTYHIELCPA